MLMKTTFIDNKKPSDNSMLRVYADPSFSKFMTKLTILWLELRELFVSREC